jgi:2-polyprenyl-3-methyl-5-hydroxy-6-metoxy-1,4-benzoquinol methylase
MEAVLISNLICTSPGISVNEALYDATYWQYQKSLNVFAGLIKGDFIKYLIPSHVTRVLEFGCSGGNIIQRLPFEDLRCVEINDVSRRYLQTHFHSVKTYKRLRDVTECMDVIYTTSVIEHVDSPLETLREMNDHLCNNGILIVGVKNDGVDTNQKFNKHKADPNHHIYTWNELLLANLIASASMVPCNVVSDEQAWWAKDACDFLGA